MQFVVLITFLLSFLTADMSTQEADGNGAEQIRAGKKFLSEKMINEWESCLHEIPFKCGQMTMTPTRGAGKMMKNSFVWFYQGDHSLSRLYYSDRKVTHISICNPEYCCTLQENADGTVTIVDLSSDVSLPYAPMSPYLFSSTIGDNSKKTIPSFIESGNLRLTSYLEKEGKHYVSLVPAISKGKKVDIPDLEGTRQIDLIFDDRFLPLPISRVVLDASNGSHNEYGDFVEAIPGIWLPTTTINKIDPDDESKDIAAAIEYGTNRKLDTEKCYVQHYGIARPGSVNIADFGRKSSLGFWVAIAFGLAGITGLIFFFSKRG